VTTYAPANLDLTCLGCGIANLDTEACPDSDTHPDVKVGEWRVRSYCLDCCGCPDHGDTWTEG
jgi:hypothetical protein